MRRQLCVVYPSGAVRAVRAVRCNLSLLEKEDVGVGGCACERSSMPLLSSTHQNTLSFDEPSTATYTGEVSTLRPSHPLARELVAETLEYGIHCKAIGTRRQKLTRPEYCLEALVFSTFLGALLTRLRP